MSPWLGRRWYDGVFWFSSLTFTFGWSLRVVGREHIPKSGPVLLLANHQSYLDPVLVGVASKRYLTFLARKTLFRPPLGAIIESLNAIPIDTANMGLDGLRAVQERLKKGESVLVFPEGTRTPDGMLQPVMPGVTMLIKKLDVPVVPVAIDGAYGAWPRRQKLPTPAPLFLPATPGTIAISIGPAVDSATLRDRPREQIVEALTVMMATQFARAQKLRRRSGHESRAE